MVILPFAQYLHVATSKLYRHHLTLKVWEDNVHDLQADRRPVRTVTRLMQLAPMYHGRLPRGQTLGV